MVVILSFRSLFHTYTIVEFVAMVKFQENDEEDELGDDETKPHECMRVSTTRKLDFIIN